MTKARDPMWDDLVNVSARLNDESAMTVSAARQRCWTTFTVTEGIAMLDRSIAAFEPVRRRRLMTSEWTEVQSVERAASTVERFLRERPDLGR